MTTGVVKGDVDQGPVVRLVAYSCPHLAVPEETSSSETTA